MRFPFYKQLDSMDCGPTCLQMIVKYYGYTIALQTIRDRSQIGKDGVSLLGIADTAEQINFRTSAVVLTFESLVNHAHLPAIVHWDQQHFVVLYKATRKRLLVADPARGLLEFSWEEFKRHWVSNREGGEDVGVALLLEPSPAFYEQAEHQFTESVQQNEARLSFRTLFDYILPYRKLIIQLLIGLVVASLFQLALPFLTQSVVDIGINRGDMDFIYVVLLAQTALILGRLTVEFIRGWILLHVSTRINISILNDFLAKLMRLPVPFFDSKNTGDILQRMSDHTRVESFLTGSTLSILFSFFNLVVFSVVLAIFNLNIFIVFAIASSLYGFWVFVFLKRKKVLDYKLFSVASQQKSNAIQLIQGMQEIKLYGAERSMRSAWEHLQVRLFRLNMKSLSINQWQQAGAFFINEGKNILITFLAAKAVIDADMTLGTMLAVQYIIGQLNSPINQLIGFMQSWQNAKISMDRLNEIHAMQEEEPVSGFLLQDLPREISGQLKGGRTQESGSLEQTVISGNDSEESDLKHLLKKADNDIRLEHLFFTYPGAGNDPVLRDINLLIPQGKTTAIVGVSGSGKTTLLKMLLKFYVPSGGDIKFGPVSLANISHKSWRSRCGVVMQESYIFSDSIARNIAVGQERIDMTKLRQAAEMANVSSFVESLPLGYNTKIGPEGVGISMGQKQRILIARAIYRDPDFIFFDEATNSLDANNESVIVKNMSSFFRGRTVVVVAHRLSTVKDADQIVVLSKGSISEFGTHQDLVSQKGEYYQLVKNQLELGT